MKIMTQSPFGSSIGTAELDDGAVTEEKLDAGQGAADHFSGASASVAKARDVVYQNTGTTSRFVRVRMNDSVGAHLSIKVGAANPPTVVADRMSVTNVASNVVVVAIVPAGQYYLVEGGSIENWYEQNL